jgi:hypothetical protein
LGRPGDITAAIGQRVSGPGRLGTYVVELSGSAFPPQLFFPKMEETKKIRDITDAEDQHHRVFVLQ